MDFETVRCFHGYGRKGYDWEFIPDEKDGYPYGTHGGECFRTPEAALRAGKRWLREVRDMRSGEIRVIDANKYNY